MSAISTQSPPVCAGSSGHLQIKDSNLPESGLVQMAFNFLSFLLAIHGPIGNKALKRYSRDFRDQISLDFNYGKPTKNGVFPPGLWGGSR